MRVDESIYIRSQNCIAQQALTNSKRPASFVKGVYPTHLSRAKGCHVWDTKGNKYIDFICGLGTNILGYANEQLNRAIYLALDRGTCLPLSSELEVEAAEALKSVLPWVTHVKFVKTGSEACSAAVRIARAKTGMYSIYSEGYHGWHDEFVALTKKGENGIRQGIPHLKGSCIHPLSEFEYLNQLEYSSGSVILEPIMTELSQKRVHYLADLRLGTAHKDTCLIFDEIITGFRFPGFTVARNYGITPDIICLGKAIAGGMPLAVVAGKKDVMECDEYFVSSTYAGEMASLAAMIKTIQLLKEDKYSLKRLWDAGTSFMERFNTLWPEELQIEGYGTRGVFKADPLIKALFMQECCLANILIGSSWFFCFPHIELMELVLNTMSDIITKLKTRSVKLLGEIPQSPFAERVRNVKAGEDRRDIKDENRTRQ